MLLQLRVRLIAVHAYFLLHPPKSHIPPPLFVSPLLSRVSDGSAPALSNFVTRNAVYTDDTIHGDRYVNLHMLDMKPGQSTPSTHLAFHLPVRPHPFCFQQEIEPLPPPVFFFPFVMFAWR